MSKTSPPREAKPMGTPKAVYIPLKMIYHTDSPKTKFEKIPKKRPSKGHPRTLTQAKFTGEKRRFRNICTQSADKRQNPLLHIRALGSKHCDTHVLQAVGGVPK